MKILDLVQGSKEWLDARYDYVTASQVPALLGFCPYQDKTDVLIEKLLREEKENDENKEFLFRRGHEAEAAARHWIKEHKQIEFIPLVGIADDLPLLASLDGHCAKNNLIFEAKYMGKKAIDELKKGVMKEHHKWQIYAQLMVSGAKYCIYFCTDTDGDSAVAEIKPHPPAFRKIKKEVEKFMFDLERVRRKYENR